MGKLAWDNTGVAYKYLLMKVVLTHTSTVFVSFKISLKMSRSSTKLWETKLQKSISQEATQSKSKRLWCPKFQNMWLKGW